MKVKTARFYKKDKFSIFGKKALTENPARGYNTAKEL